MRAFIYRRTFSAMVVQTCELLEVGTGLWCLSVSLVMPCDGCSRYRGVQSYLLKFCARPDFITTQARKPSETLFLRGE